MKRRTALLAMLGAIPGLGFLKQRKASKWPLYCGWTDAFTGEWRVIQVPESCVVDEQDFINDRFARTVWIDPRGFTGSYGFLNGKWVRQEIK